MTVCEHGQLARVCQICELLEQIAQMRQTIEKQARAVRAHNVAQAEIYNGYMRDRGINKEAVETLSSEREANALLTEELDVARREIEILHKLLADLCGGTPLTKEEIEDPFTLEVLDRTREAMESGALADNDILIELFGVGAGDDNI